MIQTLRARIEMQGFTNLSDAEIHDLRPWLKLAPALCLLTVAIGMVTQSTTVFAALIPIALAGAIFPWHPFDLPYSLFIRRWIRGPRIPPYPAPRRFACLVAAAWLCGVVWLFHIRAPLAANLLAGAFVITAAMPVIYDYCIPSCLFRHTRNLFSGWSRPTDETDDTNRMED